MSLEFTTKRKRLGHDDIVFVFVSRFLDGLKVMEREEREERRRLQKEKRELEKRVESALEVAKSASQGGAVRPVKAKRFLGESDDESDDERV